MLRNKALLYRWLVMAIMGAVSMSCSSGLGISKTERVEFVQRAISDSATPPQDDAIWADIALYDEWTGAEYQGQDSVWYRIDAEQLQQFQGMLGIHIDRVIMNAGLWVAGEEIASGGSMQPPIAQNWNRPLMFVFSQRSIASSPWIYLNVRRPKGCFGFLGEVRIGELGQIKALFARSEWRVTAAQASTYIGITLSILMFALFVIMPQKKFGWGLLTCMCFTIATLNFHVRDIPMDSRTWEFVAAASGIWGLLAAFRFGLEFLSERWSVNRFYRAFNVVLVATGLGALALVVLPHPYFHTLYNTLIVMSIGLATFVWVLLVIDQQGVMRWIVAVSAVAIVALFVPDVGHQLRLISPQFPSLAPLTGPVMAFGLIALVVSSQLENYRQLQTLNATLVARVDAGVAKIKKHELEQALSLERERLTRELHDGLGGHLVSTLALAEHDANPEQIQESVRRALSDLRLVVNATNPTDTNLNTMFVQLRQQFERPLLLANTSLVWRVDELPEPRGPTAESYLGIARIAQEALTNVLRHAHARQVMVKAYVDEENIVVELDDDGCGLDNALETGRGLRNMQERAAALGAILDIVGSHHGTKVRLSVPLADGV